MKQWEAVVQALEKLGGEATLAELYSAVMDINECVWGTRTPMASIRRILQTRHEFVRIRPGLWALRERRGKDSLRSRQSLLDVHAYYQGILASIGKWKGLDIYIPPSDRSKYFARRPLKEYTTLVRIPACSYPHFVKIMSHVDVVWFNRRKMPESFFEIEHTTDFRDSLVKFVELQDFAARMYIVADEKRKKQFDRVASFDAFTPIRDRVQFLNYEELGRRYEVEVQKASLSNVL
jgi:hypothetical protein